MNAYAIRSSVLKRMGFSNYASYLDSKLWKGIRAEVLTRDRLCRVCGIADATQVHHLAYYMAIMRGYENVMLVGICGPCHHNIEFDGDKKLTLAQANRRGGFLDLVKAYRKATPNPDMGGDDPDRMCRNCGKKGQRFKRPKSPKCLPCVKAARAARRKLTKVDRIKRSYQRLSAGEKAEFRAWIPKLRAVKSSDSK